MTITVFNGSDVREVTIRTALNMLSDDTDAGAILLRLGYGEDVDVLLKDDVQASMTLTRFVTPALLPEPTLPLLEYQPPGRSRRTAFEVECRFMFEVDAKVYCSADTPARAAELAEQIFQGAMPPDGSFSIVVNRDELSEMFARTEHAMDSGDLTHFPVRSVLVERVNPRHQALLEHAA